MSTIDVQVPIGDGRVCETATVPIRQIEEIRTVTRRNPEAADGVVIFLSGRHLPIRGVRDAARQMREHLAASQREESTC
jgi:hypothetical protein